MNQKRIAALAFVASLAATTIPTLAGTATGTVTVKWNTQALATISVHTQATSGGTSPTRAAQTIYWNGNTDPSSGCNAVQPGVANSGTDASADGTINFGNVTPSGTQYTDCMETNAANVYVATNDTNGWNVTASVTTQTNVVNYGAAGGELLCILPNGAYANNLAYTASARAAAVSIVSTTACPAGDFAIPASPTTSTLASAATSTVATNLNSDMELVLAPNAPSSVAPGSSVVVTYTLTTL